MSTPSSENEIQTLLSRRDELAKAIEQTDPNKKKKFKALVTEYDEINFHLYLLTAPPEVLAQYKAQWNAEMRSKNREYATEQMAGGIGCFVLAAIVSGVAYYAATSSESGGKYVVFYGAMLVGAWRFFRGIRIYLKYRD